MKTTKPGKPAKARAKQAALMIPCQETKQLDSLMRLMTHVSGKAVQFEVAEKQVGTGQGIWFRGLADRGAETGVGHFPMAYFPQISTG